MFRRKVPAASATAGMVLIAVLWMVAALSIIVTGVTAAVRDESRRSSAARERVEAGALGEAAVQLALQSLAAEAAPSARLARVDVVFRGVAIQVHVMPLNGLIDINGAPLPLLARLYEIGGGLPVDRAEALAQATVEARSRKSPKGNSQQFEAPEDLLQVPGIEYALYARLSRLLVAGPRGGGKVNPMAAPNEVLIVLAGGNLALASQIAQARESGQVGIDTTALDANFITNTPVRQFSIEARVPLSSGGGLRVAHYVDMNVRAKESLPWRTFHTFRALDPAPRKNP